MSKSRSTIPITSFRIVAVATAGANRFGTGFTSIRTNRDLIILSGIAPVVRQGDKFRSTFTLRNTTEKALDVRVAASVSGVAESLAPQTFPLGSGESRDISWDLTAPMGNDSLKYQIEATAGAGIGDRLSVTQKVVAIRCPENLPGDADSAIRRLPPRCGTSQRRTARSGEPRRDVQTITRRWDVGSSELHGKISLHLSRAKRFQGGCAARLRALGQYCRRNACLSRLTGIARNIFPRCKEGVMF